MSTLRSRQTARKPPARGRACLICVGVLALAVIGALSISKLAQTSAQQSAAQQSAAQRTVAPPTAADQPMSMSKPSEGAAPMTPQHVVDDHWDTAAKVSPVTLDLGSSHSSVKPIGLNADGALQAPSDARTIGWYSSGPAPGQAGAAVLTGTSSGVGAALAHLGRLGVGSSLDVRRADGTSVEFKVTRVVHAGADDFPTRDVYTPTKKPSLRVIAATGTGTGIRDVIVFATASGLVQRHA